MKRAMSFILFCGKDNTLPLNSCFTSWFMYQFCPMGERRTCHKSMQFFFASFDDAKMLSNLGVALTFQQPDVCNRAF